MKEKQDMLNILKQIVCESVPSPSVEDVARPRTSSPRKYMSENLLPMSEFNGSVMGFPHGHSAPASRVQSDNESCSDLDSSSASHVDSIQTGSRPMNRSRRARHGLLRGRRHRASFSPDKIELPLLKARGEKRATVDSNATVDDTLQPSRPIGSKMTSLDSSGRNESTTMSIVARKLDRYGISNYRRRRFQSAYGDRFAALGPPQMPGSEPPGATAADWSGHLEEKRLVTVEHEMQKVVQLERRYDKANMEWQELKRKCQASEETLADISEVKRCLLESQHNLVISQEQDRRNAVWNLVMSGVWVTDIPESVLSGASEQHRNEQSHAKCLPLAPQLFLLLERLLANPTGSSGTGQARSTLFTPFLLAGKNV